MNDPRGYWVNESRRLEAEQGTTQFAGETAWEAFMNHNSVSIEEEQAFKQWLRGQEPFPLGMLGGLWAEWKKLG